MAHKHETAVDSSNVDVIVPVLALPSSLLWVMVVAATIFIVVVRINKGATMASIPMVKITPQRLPSKMKKNPRPRPPPFRFDAGDVAANVGEDMESFKEDDVSARMDNDPELLLLLLLLLPTLMDDAPRILPRQRRR